jgi:hydroxypyruvate isomerase
MKRRKFVQQSLLTGASIFTAAAVSASEKTYYKTAAEKPFNLDYGFHDGMFKNSAG